MLSGFCNPTLPRTTAYDPHRQCRGCDCTAPDCHTLPADAQVRTGNEDTPVDAALLAVEGAVPGDAARTPADWPVRQPTSPQCVYDDLLAGALALRAQADRINETVVAANCTTWEQAVEVLHHVRLARTTAQVCEEALTKWIATAWREVGIRDPQEVDGIGVIDVRRGKERKAWDHEGLGPAVIDANLEQVDGEVPDPFTVARWVLDAAAPSYWRTTVLKGLGIDPDEWCQSKPGRVSVQITTHDHIGATA